MRINQKRRTRSLAIRWGGFKSRRREKAIPAARRRVVALTRRIPAEDLFLSLRHRSGFGLMLLIAEYQGGKWQHQAYVEEVLSYSDGDPSRGRKAGNWPNLKPRNRRSLPDPQGFAALGHAARLQILFRLLAGPANYRQLRDITSLQVGPLYHHIRQLRLSGLIRPPRRDTYELTKTGRIMTMLARACSPIIRRTR